MDIAVRVSAQVVPAGLCKAGLEGRGYIGISDPRQQFVGPRLGTGIDDLATRRADILKNARPWIGLFTAQSRLDRVRPDLLQIGIADEKIRQAAWARGSGAAQRRRGWRPIAVGIAGIGSKTRKDLVGQSAGRVETAEGVIAGQ